MTDAELAARLAHTLGPILERVRGAELFKADGLGRVGDQIADRYLVNALREHRPDDGIICEEMRERPRRLEKSRVWIVDPIDGTREFAEGRADWAIHVGLAIDGDAAVGAVGMPCLDGGAVFRSDHPVALAAGNAMPRIVVSRTRPPGEATTIAERIGGSVVPMGSAGAKAMAVIRGEADIYLHSGGMSEWDSCAPVAVAQAHGLHCSHLDGSPLRYNSGDLSMSDLLICRPEWARPVLDAI